MVLPGAGFGRHSHGVARVHLLPRFVTEWNGEVSKAGEAGRAGEPAAPFNPFWGKSRMAETIGEAVWLSLHET